MGAFRTTIVVESTERRGDMRTVDDALVDTGSEFTWVPRAVLVDLGIRPELTKRFIVANAQRKQLVPAGPILAGVSLAPGAVGYGVD
jgi:predicted aspartyl protease